MEFRLNLTLAGGFFAVPNDIVDKHMNLCTEKQLKTLLLMLRSPEQTATAEQIAQKLKIASADAQDHLLYWTEQGVISLCSKATAKADSPQLNSTVQPQKAASEQAATTQHAAPTGQKITSNAHVRLSAADINRMAQKDSNVALLLQETQLLMGRELTPSQTSLVMELYSEYGLSPQYIFTLITYCVSNGKRNMNYIGSVAAGWMEKGITTVEQAEAEICRLQESHSREAQVKSIIGIRDRNLSTSQKAHVTRWFEEYNMSTDMIRLAFDKMVDNTGKVSFPYMDKMMLNWHSQGLSTPEQVALADQKRKAAKPEEKTSFDMELINKRFELGNIK